MSIFTDDAHMKDLLKQAIRELLIERDDALYKLFSEALEDILMMSAIRDGENSETISKAEVLRLLGGAG